MPYKRLNNYSIKLKNQQKSRRAVVVSKVETRQAASLNFVIASPRGAAIRHAVSPRAKSRGLYYLFHIDRDPSAGSGRCSASDCFVVFLLAMTILRDRNSAGWPHKKSSKRLIFHQVLIIHYLHPSLTGQEF